MVRHLLALFASFGLLLILGNALLHVPAAPVDLAEQVRRALPESGVDSPVTAVLLNFRAFDTLLEITVLVVAVIIGLALKEVQPDDNRAPVLENKVLMGLVSWLVPLIWLTSGYVLWSGSHQPGGAFQAGAILAAALIMLQLTGRMPPLHGYHWVQVAWVFGLAIFLGLASLTFLFGQAFMAYPKGWAGTFILLIEAALTVSISLILAGLFMAAPLRNRSP